MGEVIINELKGKAKANMDGLESVYLDAEYLNGGKVCYVDSPTDVSIDDVLILWDGSQSGSVYHGFEGALGSTLKSFKPKYSGDFLYQFLIGNQEKIYNSYRTPNIPHVIKNFTSEFKINTPKEEEQNKIGNFFKQLDNTITLHERELELLKLMKKGFLQQLFSETNQLFPKIRFANFQGEWEQRKLKEVTEKIGSGKTPKGGNEVYLSKGIPLLRSQNIFSDKVNLEDIVFISEEINNTMKNSAVKKNDILLNITGASIGRSAVYNYSEEANVNQHVCIIRPKDDKSSYFIQLNLTSNNGQNQIDMNQAGGGREGLNFQQISKFEFNYPKIKEQEKIGDFFKQLDKIITIHENKIENIKKLKSAFLQKMFI